MPDLPESEKYLIARGAPPGPLDDKLRANWDGLPEDVRARCIAQLRSKLPTAVPRLMRAQHSRGLRIGSHDVRFHFSYGMLVRNLLREVVLDKDLPALEQPGGELASNWDDYYSGALEQLTEECA